MKPDKQSWLCNGLSTFLTYRCIDGFHGTFTMGTGGHYITMLPADWSISTSHGPLPSSCHSEKMLRNPSILPSLSALVVFIDTCGENASKKQVRRQ